MKRDMDLVRAIMRSAEADTLLPDLAEFTQQEIAYHVWLLNDAGFVNALIQSDHRGVPQHFHINAITWEGHEFLDAMRDDTLWKKAKENFIKPGASFTAKLVFEWLKVQISHHILGDASGSTLA